MNKVVKRGLGRLPTKAQVFIENALEAVERAKTDWMLFRVRQASPTVSIINAEQISSLCQSEKIGPVCHVLGSGWSLLSGLKKINPAFDFVLGFNFSALAWPEPDMHFVEIASNKTERLSSVSKAQHLLIREVGLLRKRRVVFKNVWEGKNEVKPMAYGYGEGAFFLKDYPVRCLSHSTLDLVADKVLNPRQGYIRQYSSTSLTLIGIAYRLGFERIVLHGVDFSGPHFYDLPDFNCLANLEGIVKMIRNPLVEMGSKHLTAVDGLGQQAVIPVLRERLTSLNVELLTGSAESPLSEILPVYSE